MFLVDLVCIQMHLTCDVRYVSQSCICNFSGIYNLMPWGLKQEHISLWVPVKLRKFVIHYHT